MSVVITIDGPAGSGKSTAARGLASRLGFRFLDTGAMYRTVALVCLQNNVDLEDEEGVTHLANKLDVTLHGDRVLADGTDVTTAIRTPEVTRGSSIVATYPGVRGRLVELQRKAAEMENVVTEGRDQGTIVFPDAACKFFLTARSDRRALRRQEDMQRRGQSVDLTEVLAQQDDRDARDERRSTGPLKPADDAIRIDTSEMDINEVLDLLIETIRRKLPPK